MMVQVKVFDDMMVRRTGSIFNSGTGLSENCPAVDLGELVQVEPGDATSLPAEVHTAPRPAASRPWRLVGQGYSGHILGALHLA